MNRLYDGQMLNSVEHYIGEKIKTVANKSDIGYLIKMYGSNAMPNLMDSLVKAQDITLPNYSSIFRGFEEEEVKSFQSTLNFFDDLCIASGELKGTENKKNKLIEIFQ